MKGFGINSFDMDKVIAELNKEFRLLDPTEILNFLDSKFDDIVFSTSFGKEDQVITSFIAESKTRIDLFTLDTGRLFEETYEVHHKTLKKYGLAIQVFYPNTKLVEDLVSEKGPYSFYDSVEERKLCCYVRKIEPLRRALIGKQVWITGLRSNQSSNREKMEMVEYDEQNKIIKVHPLLNWSESKIDQFILKNNIPINSLHDKSYPSIGCEPCTRAVNEGEEIRAGRWWWENSKKECGLHQ